MAGMFAGGGSARIDRVRAKGDGRARFGEFRGLRWLVSHPDRGEGCGFGHAKPKAQQPGVREQSRVRAASQPGAGASGAASRPKSRMARCERARRAPSGLYPASKRGSSLRIVKRTDVLFVMAREIGCKGVGRALGCGETHGGRRVPAAVQKSRPLI